MGYIEFIIIIFAFSSFMFIFWLMRQKYARQDMVERVKSVGVAAGGSSGLKTGKHTLGEAYQAGVSEIFDMATGVNRSEYKVMFEQAGWNPRKAKSNIIITKLGLALAMAVLAIIFVNIFGKIAAQPLFMKILIVIGAGITGVFLFDKFMGFVINSRYKRILKDLHSAVELLVVCSRAGMSIDKGMERVAQEVSQYNPDLAREFYLTAIELEVMPNRKLAYENLKRRVSIPLIYGMTTTLIQAEEQGSSVSDSLRVLSDEFRSQVLLNFERRAAKLPATLSIPVVLFTLPTLMAVILGPAIIKLMSDTSLF